MFYIFYFMVYVQLKLTLLCVCSSPFCKMLYYWIDLGLHVFGNSPIMMLYVDWNYCLIYRKFHRPFI